MNEIQVFENEQFGTIRTITIDGEPWFVGKDVAESLGYAKARNAILRHVDDEDKKYAPIQGSLGGKQKTVIINESGLYSLILSSKLETAKDFKRWITSVVLPTIRKYGAYATDEILDRVQNNSEEAKKLFLLLKEEKLRSKGLEIRNNDLTVENDRLSKENASLTEMVGFINRNDNDGNLITASEIAAAYKMSASSFNRLLAALGIQYKAHGTWLLVDKYANCGYTFTNKRQKKKNGAVEFYLHTRWTDNGARFLYKILKSHSILPMYERLQNNL